jgi:hypothetical protein
MLPAKICMSRRNCRESRQTNFFLTASTLRPKQSVTKGLVKFMLELLTGYTKRRTRTQIERSSRIVLFNGYNIKIAFTRLIERLA